MQALVNVSEAANAIPTAKGVADGLTGALAAPFPAAILALAGILFVAYVLRSRRLYRRKLQYIVTAYAERQLLQERPARAPSA